MVDYSLSKSTFIRGLQCHKALYLNKYHKHLKPPVTPQLQAVFKRGTDVGILAQQLFPGGKDATPSKKFDFSESLQKTRDYIEKGEKVIYEAAFLRDGILVLLDILVKEEDGWHAYEVKSSSGVSDVYLSDAAIQYHVIHRSGLELKDISIVYLNRKYVRKGKLEIDKLFTSQSVFDRVLKIQEDFPDEISEMKSVLADTKVPDVKIGTHCTTPYECDFIAHCWREVPENSVFEISGMNKERQFELYDKGKKTVFDIDTGEEHLSKSQQIQIEAAQSGEVLIDKPEIRAFIEELQYPLFYMDFETFMPAVPLFDNSSPYEQIPFQYSIHYQEEEGAKCKHYEFLAEAGTDPRASFLSKLLEHTEGSGDIIVYNKQFEKYILKKLKKLFPEKADQITGRQKRIRDLMLPFKKKYYYHPDMKGSYSIKNVLPALVPGLHYQDLEVSDGQLASMQFEQLQTEDDIFTIAEKREELLKYCKRDTYAMVRLLEELKKV